MFTSRLPISTSARRPTNHGDGSTSFASSGRPSNIPVTARKANLFTPQTKRPFQTGHSTASKSYLSTGIATEKKYQRPLKPMPDRDQQVKMFNKLAEFMKTNGSHLPQPDPKKFFSSVSTTESSRIFELLISRLYPDFQISRLEVDVPEALTLLEYPYIRSVTKSALVSVTTRQAVVGLLVIFDWLLDQASFQANLESLEEDGGPVNVTLQILRITRMYPDRVKEANQELTDQLYPLHDIHDKENELRQISEECDQLAADIGEIEQDYDLVRVMEEDIRKCDEYTAQMQKYIETQLEMANENKKTIQELATEEDYLRKQLVALNEKIKSHPVSTEELERNQGIIEDSERKISEKSKLLEKSTRDLTELEQEEASCSEKLRVSSEESCIILKDLIGFLDSVSGESRILTESKIKLNDWLVRLQQDINQRLLHEYDRFCQGLEATMPSLQSELQDELTGLKDKLENHKATNLKHTRELSRLAKAIESYNRETEIAKRQHLEDMDRLELKMAEEDRRMFELDKESELKRESYRKKFEHDSRSLDNHKKALQEVSELNEKHLLSVLATQRNQLGMMVDCIEKSFERWRKVQKICESDESVLKLACKRLRKRKNLKVINKDAD